MGLPDDWQARRSSLPRPGEDEPIGHQEEGRTIALHSLAVAVEHQNKGLGSVLMKAYIQRIKDSKIADRIALLAHDHLVGFYEGVGFTDMGPSACTFGGGGWNNLVRTLMPRKQILIRLCTEQQNRSWSSRRWQKTSPSTRS
jgi:GNAT superfamily N-acetyltransferase